MKKENMDSEHIDCNNGQRIILANQEQILQQKSNCNKDSINTSIEEIFQNNQGTKKHYSTWLNIKKTQPISKEKSKKAIQILKHKKVLQTLRNITRNIKSQLNGQKHLIKNNSQKILQKQVKIQPQIKNSSQAQIVQIGVQKCPQQGMKPVNIKQSDENNYCERQLNICDHRNVINSPSKQQYCSPAKQVINQIKNYPVETINLFSRRKSCMEKIPVYEDRILSIKKQLRNLTIQRMVDNDVSSDQEQVQMGVGYMYYELMSSCHKQKDKKINSIAKLSNKKITGNRNEKQKRQKQENKLQRIKQKLVFI